MADSSTVASAHRGRESGRERADEPALPDGFFFASAGFFFAAAGFGAAPMLASASACASAREAGFAFSIEPGIYRSGVHGARIEDIVVCGDDGPLPMNLRPHDLQVIE